MIRPHTTAAGSRRFGVRVYEGAGKWRWVGTFETEEDARTAERLAKPPRRRCLGCLRAFSVADARRKRCDRCLARAAAPPSDDHWLYRCFDSADALLYVGITSSGIKRFRRHGNERSWWPQVARIEIEHFASAGEAAVAERTAIRLERPLNNRRGAARSVPAGSGAR